ncbi:unnamed protein product [Rotaria sp. Silwood2]|nr:unnamed protein product [Rotaria sp. Silwood2]
MSKLIFYSFAIIFFIGLFYLVSGALGQKLNTENAVQVNVPNTIAKVEDSKESEAEEDELDDITQDDSTDETKPVVIIPKSNSIRTVSIHINSFLSIGFIFFIIHSNCFI